MATNPFAQFDPNPAQATPTPPANNNPFAQFDPNPAQATPTPPQSEPPKATFIDSLKQGFDSTKAGEMLDLHRAYTKSIPELEQLSKTASNSITKFLYDSELENAKKGSNETQQWLSEYQANRQIAPRSPELEAFNKTNSFSDAATEFLKNPLEITKHGLAQSAVPMGLMLGNAYLGGRAGGTSGMAAAGGLTSFDVEYKNGVMDGLQKAGVDIGNSDSLNAALNNKPLMDKIHLQAEQKAVVVGAADAASMGIAGKTLSLKPVKNALAQGVVQAGLGAGGEAAGSLYSGQDVNPPAVMLEGLLEIPGGAAETVIAARHSNKPVAATNTTNNNTDNPFKQFDPKPIPNTGDDNVNIYDEGKADNQSPNNSGIGALIASGEGDYGSFNRGVAGDARGEKIDFSQMTVGELMQRQALPKGHPSRIFAVGKYQIVKNTLKEAVNSLKIPLDTPVTPELQEQIFSQHLLDKKRPDISGFIRGEHNDVRRAQLAGAQEWASIADPLTGKSYYHGKGNNSASISADKFGAALQSARRTYADAIAQGKTPAEAWSQAIGSGAVTQAWQNTDTNTVTNASVTTGMESPATPDILQAALDTANQTETSLNNTYPIAEQALAEIPHHPGQDVRIRTEAGDWHDGQYQVIEADSINSTSSKDSNQYRDRNRFGLTTQVNKIADNLEYDLVGRSPVMEYGAPVVGKDGTVIAGNGRLAGIQQAYANQKADDYKLKLLADAKNLGVDPSAIQGMKNPVLIRRLKNNADIKQLATLSNEGGAARMSPLEQAKVDAERIGSLHGFTPTESGEISQQSSGELLKRLMAKTPQNQHNSLIDSGGFMSQEGARRVQNALLYMAYGDSPALSRLVESTDDSSLNVLRGLNKAAPALAEMRDNIKAGISHDANIIPEIVAAVEVFTRLKARGVNVQEWLGQIDAFNNAPPEIKSILSFLNNNTRSPNAISSMLTNYANLLKGYGSPSQQDIFDAKPPTKQEVFNRAIQSTGQSPAKFDQIQPATATNTEHGTGSTGYTGDNEFNHGTTKPEPSKSIKAGNSQVKNTVNAKDLGLDPNADLNTESSGDAGINLASQAKKPVVDNKIKFSPTHELPSGTLVVESEDEKGIWVDEEGIEYESVAYPLPSNTDTKDANNEPNNTRNLESGSEPTRNGNGSIQAPVQATRERNRSGSGGVDKPTNKERDSSVAGNTIPNVSPTNSRAGSNNSVDSNTTSRESVAAKEGAPRNNERKRSTADGKNGLSDAKSSPAKPIKEDANLTPLLNDSVSSIDDADIEHVKTQDKPSTEFQEKVQEQIAAESIPHIENDLKNIQDTLPILQPEQHDDVKFAEARFNDPKAAHLPGVLFTNGTGTGKTFTGLGVAKRFQRQGKDNILIIVPSDKIANDWMDAASHFNMSVKMLDNTKDNGGSGPVVTTYANFGNNPSLLLRNWDLIIPDESHKINQNEAGNPTWAEYMLDAVSAKHDLTENSWGMLVHDLSKWEALDKKIRKAASISDKPKHFSDVFSTYYYNSGAITAEQKINFEKEVRALTERSRARLEKTKPRRRSKVAFLSATPFAYHKSMRYAAGYLFELPKTQTAGYNVAKGFDAFLQNKFGYTMRHGKLNRPPAEVDTTLAERNLNEELQKAGAIRGRRLKVDADYSRQFVLVDDAIGSKIEDGISFLMRADKYSGFTGQLRERFNHLARLQLLEAIKVKYAIDRAKWHISKYGRKVVIFHDFKKGGNIPHPFKFEPTATVAQHDIDRFNKERPDLVNLPLSDLPSPIDAILKAFGDRAVIFNGDVSKAARNKNVKLFNDDDSNVDVILVQRDSGKEGIGLHDTTGNHQRVLLDLGLPTKPTDAIQTEGRIYRFGVLTNAIIEYFTTGLDYENHAFGTSVASRSSTAENLALGHEGRNLLTAFVEAYKEAGDSPPAKDQGTGGKKSDFNRTESSLLDQAKLAFWGRQKNSKRRDQREGKDYYATPEPIGLKMAEWLQLKPNDHAAETSAGHGAIARWFPNFSRNTFIEQSYSLAGELKMLGNGDVKHEDFLNFRPARNFEGIAMNPPYGSGGSDAIKHFARGYSMLRNGGRIVALIPDGGSATKRFDDWFQSDNGKDARLIAEISLPNSTFKNAGTSVKTRLIIVDKIPQAWLKNGANVPHTRKLSFDHIDGLNDLFDALNEVNFSDRTTEPSPTASTVIPDTKQVVDEPTTTKESTPDTTNDNNDSEDKKPVADLASLYWNRLDRKGKEKAIYERIGINPNNGVGYEILVSPSLDSLRSPLSGNAKKRILQSLEKELGDKLQDITPPAMWRDNRIKAAKYAIALADNGFLDMRDVQAARHDLYALVDLIDGKSNVEIAPKPEYVAPLSIKGAALTDEEIANASNDDLVRSAEAIMKSSVLASGDRNAWHRFITADKVGIDYEPLRDMLKKWRDEMIVYNQKDIIEAENRKERFDGIYGSLSQSELKDLIEKKYKKALNLQHVGRREFSVGDNNRSTSAAVANESSRMAVDEIIKLEGYYTDKFPNAEPLHLFDDLSIKRSVSTNQSPNPTTKNIIIASLSARLGQKTVNQLIRHSRLVISSAKPNSNVAASYSNNTVTLYPENIQQGDEWAVFLHEAGEHANLSNMLGQAKYQQVTNQFKKLLDENNPDAMLAVKRVPPNTPKEHIASEQLGYLIENITSNIAQTPKAIFLGKRISSFVRAWAFDKLPQWLTSHIQLTPFDIQALAARAARSWPTFQNSPILRSSEDNLSKTGDSEQTQYSIAKIFNEASKKISPYHKRTFIEGSANAARMLSNELFGSIHQSIRGIGTPSAKKIADMMRRPMEYESSTEQGAMDDIDAATTAEHGRFEGRLQDILEPISGRFGISSADREALVRGLHTGIIPKKLANTAKHLRVWLDDIKDYQEAAGLEFGYIKNYFPRSYDLKKVLNNSDDFIAMLQRHGYSQSVAEDILARIVNGDMLPEMPVNDTSRISVGSNNRIYQQRVMDKEGYPGKSSHQKQRMLDIPYDELSPFLNNDLESMLSRYMRNAIKRAEYARKFGANEEVLNELVKNMVDEIRKGEGVTYGYMTAQQAVTFVYDAADIMQGTFAKPSTATGGKLSRTLLNLQILSKLALASLSAAPEFLTPLLLSGSPIAYSRGFVQGMASGAYEAIRATDRLITGKNHLPQSEAYAVAEDIGVITHAEIMDMLESMHAWDSGNKTILGVAVNKFMTITLQEPITRLQKVIAVKTFTSAVRRWSKTATQSKNSDQMLRDFGIDPIEAKKWADANYPADDTLTFAINRGAIRFANSAITTPGKANKSRFFQRQNGLYPLINQFQTFSNVFGNTLLRRVTVQMKRGQGGQQLVMMAAMIGMMALAFAAQELRDEWKYGKNKPYKNAIDNNPARRVMNAFDRAGFTGSLSRLFELFSPYKYTYSQQGAARIAGLAGPTAGDLGKFIDAFLVDQDNPKKQADMQAKFIVNSLPAANAIPYKLKQDKLVDPLARSLK